MQSEKTQRHICRESIESDRKMCFFCHRKGRGPGGAGAGAPHGADGPARPAPALTAPSSDLCFRSAFGTPVYSPFSILSLSLSLSFSLVPLSFLLRFPLQVWAAATLEELQRLGAPRHSVPLAPVVPVGMFPPSLRAQVVLSRWPEGAAFLQAAEATSLTSIGQPTETEARGTQRGGESQRQRERDQDNRDREAFRERKSSARMSDCEAWS